MLHFFLHLFLDTTQMRIQVLERGRLSPHVSEVRWTSVPEKEGHAEALLQSFSDLFIFIDFARASKK